ncbi:protein phosphatase 2C domain-containing protein [Labedaea rhizosphaerae]|uniref:Protein phosphatase 2C-like protein n=1 Tax=Labedaea rhizosphaerae TaxID=598644 RepID=A0A4R6SNL9_LABRH|nr:protein phosphatase 2C domain-containing protein [Labedaea rhizosphaerae]TDQ05531.1 protein phosphatase 2C-like protein [Labedaea rhizosphaerae]
MTDIQTAQLAGTGVDGVIRPTEDVVVSLGTSVVLLDGATSLRPGLPSGGWYAATLAAQLGTELTTHPELGLEDILARAIAELARRHGLRPGASASSTVAMLRWTAEVVEALVLADSPIVAFTSDGVQLVADERLASLPRRGSYRDRLRSGGGYGTEHASALRESARRFDALRNAEGGFWVAEADPDAAYHAITARWPREQVRAVLMASDGMSCGVEDYGLFADWSAVLESVRTQGAQAVLRQVRDAERGDPDGTRWPRPKVHDDKTLVLVDWA